MFIYDYWRDLFVGTRKEAFDAGKTLSDVIAMANRAVWIFGFSLLAQRAEIGLIGVEELAWWEDGAFDVIYIVCGLALPTLMSIQIYLVALADIRTIGNCYGRWSAFVVLTIVAIVLYGSVAVVANKIRSEFYHSQTAKADDDRRKLWLTLTERQNQQTLELLKELKPDPVSTR
ncbi:hypothetical protein [Agrobacterium radiobacter]|uniref:hypothetical protein n=1 Tax=Agrobacterium radiobacter TaxID=362 RepID=UPI003CE5AE0F